MANGKFHPDYQRLGWLLHVAIKNKKIYNIEDVTKLLKISPCTMRGFINRMNDGEYIYVSEDGFLMPNIYQRLIDRCTFIQNITWIN
jgi:predicted transcriptional regulator of viral defense system